MSTSCSRRRALPSEKTRKRLRRKASLVSTDRRTSLCEKRRKLTCAFAREGRAYACGPSIRRFLLSCDKRRPNMRLSPGIQRSRCRSRTERFLRGHRCSPFFVSDHGGGAGMVSPCLPRDSYRAHRAHTPSPIVHGRRMSFVCLAFAHSAHAPCQTATARLSRATTSRR